MNFGSSYKSISSIKATLIVRIQVYDLLNPNKILEEFEHAIIPAAKVKPFLQRETLSIDLENYKEVVEKAKDDYNLEVQLDGHPLIKNEIAIKTLDRKRVQLDGNEVQKRSS